MGGCLRKMIPFTRWINQFKKEDSDRGILARWFLSVDFTLFCTMDEVVGQMKKTGCTNVLINIFENCWKQFESIPNAKISILTPDGRGRTFRKPLEN